jgi:membrane protein DedA with SNARE-associated domain
LSFARKIHLTDGAVMPKDAFLILAAFSFALSVALFIYGAWTWIIQFNGDVYYHRAGFVAVAGSIFLVIGLVRRWRRM